MIRRHILMFSCFLASIGIATGQKLIMDDPCFEDMLDCGGSGGSGITVTFTGPTSAALNDVKYYNVSVYGGGYYTTTYSLSGGTILSQGQNFVQVKWTSAGSKWVRANVNSGGSLTSKTVNVSVLAISRRNGKRIHAYDHLCHQ